MFVETRGEDGTGFGGERRAWGNGAGGGVFGVEDGEGDVFDDEGLGCERGDFGG